MRAPALNIRTARLTDVAAIHAIYAPIVEQTAISFELEVPSIETMAQRIASTLSHLPWLVSTDADGAVSGYVYASAHRKRAAYRWAVDTTVYIRADCRGRGIGSALYARLFEILPRLGYFQAYAGITLPNAGSVALHEAQGFRHVGTYTDVGYKLGCWHSVGWWQKTLRAPEPPAELRAF